MLAFAVLAGLLVIAWTIRAGFRRVEYKLHGIGFMVEWMGRRVLPGDWITDDDIAGAVEDERLPRP